MIVIATRNFNFGGNPVAKGEELVVTGATGDMLVRSGNAILPVVINEADEEIADGDEL